MAKSPASTRDVAGVRLDLRPAAGAVPVSMRRGTGDAAWRWWLRGSQGRRAQSAPRAVALPMVDSELANDDPDWRPTQRTVVGLVALPPRSARAALPSRAIAFTIREASGVLSRWRRCDPGMRGSEGAAHDRVPDDGRHTAPAVASVRRASCDGLGRRLGDACRFGLAALKRLNKCACPLADDRRTTTHG